MSDGRTSTSTRQVISRILLDILANKDTYSSTLDNKPANSSELKELLESINREFQPAFYLSESTTPDLILNVSADTIQNPSTSKNRQHSQTNGSFTSGTVTFPAADGGLATVSSGTDLSVSLGVGLYNKFLIQVDENGDLSVKQGVAAANPDNVTVPDSDPRSVAIGYVVLFNDTGVIQNVTNDNIYQYVNQEVNNSLTVQESDGAPTVSGVTTIIFPGGTVTDNLDGSVSVEAGGGSGGVVDSQGNGDICLKPTITEFALQSPDSNIWQFTVNEDGEIQAEDGLSLPVTNVSILREDGQPVSFRVTNTGLLQAVDPPDSGTTQIDNIFLEAPSGRAWELKVRPFISNFFMRSPDQQIWEISIDDDGALQATQVSSATTIRNIKIRRDDLTEVGITITNDGELETQNPVQAGAELFSNLRLASPDSTVFEIKINNDDIIRTTTDGQEAVIQKNIIFTSTELTLSNQLRVCNDREETLFKVQEFEELDPLDQETQREGAYLELPMVTLDELRAIENPVVSNPGRVVVEVYLDTDGMTVPTPPNRVVKVFYDEFDNEWKFSHDFTVVFP